MKNMKIFINKKLKSGDMFCDIEIDSFKIYHDVQQDRYWLQDLEANDIRELELGYELRYDDTCIPSNDELINGYGHGFNVQDYGADITAEFDEPIETSGNYIWRYGYFKFLEPKQKPSITYLINLIENTKKEAKQYVK